MTLGLQAFRGVGVLFFRSVFCLLQWECFVEQIAPGALQ